MSDIRNPFDWSELYQYRREVGRLYPDVMKLKIAKRPQTILGSHIEHRREILEIGAGDRKFETQLRELYGDIEYRSFDIDQRHHHDYYSLQDIVGPFSIICMFEVIEHLSIEIAYQTLSRSYDLLKPDGMMLITTPNIYYPPAFLRDVTHITPWAYDELAGFGKLFGFEVMGIYRLYHNALHRKILRRLLLHPLHKLIGIDYAKQVAVLLHKPI
jgi:SAM-dependent methyltransferase